MEKNAKELFKDAGYPFFKDLYDSIIFSNSRGIEEMNYYLDSAYIEIDKYGSISAYIHGNECNEALDLDFKTFLAIAQQLREWNLIK